MIRVAINGFGRIGRNFLRTIFEDPSARKKLNVTVINIGPANPETVAHMFTYDSLMGTFPGKVSSKKNELIVDNHAIKIIAETDPEKINWKKYKVDWVVDASGRFTKRDQALRHIKSGAAHVLITAPAHNEDITIIPGVNEGKFNQKKDKIVSLGSCTTNAFVPLLAIMQDAFGIEEGFMTTTHAYTNSQVLLDIEGEDLRRSRAAALNIIPTTTGASEMLGKIMPELKGKVSAIAIRVPVAKVSLIEVVFKTAKKISAKQINQAFEVAKKKQFKGIVDLSMEPLVSSDYSKSPYSLIVDGLLTSAQGNLGQVFGWYDNEWGYSERLKDFLLYVDTKK